MKCRDSCDVCGREFMDTNELSDCEQTVCPYAVAQLDAYAPLDFSRDRPTVYLPEYVDKDTDK